MNTSLNNIHLTLIRLVRRIHPDYTWWYVTSELIPITKHTCYLCSKQFNSLEINDHGLVHLKEKNLLPFL